MNYEFQPSSKPGPNRYVASWQETGWREIDLPFNAVNLATLLQQAAGLLPTDFTHQDIAHWCERYIMAERMGEFRQSSDSTDCKVASIAEDVSVQWDLFLANTFTLAQLQALNFSEVQLPSEWFHDWLRSTNGLQSTGKA